MCLSPFALPIDEERGFKSHQLPLKGDWHLWNDSRDSGLKNPGNGSVFVDKAVNQIITAAESAMGEKPSCKATD